MIDTEDIRCIYCGKTKRLCKQNEKEHPNANFGMCDFENKYTEHVFQNIHFSDLKEELSLLIKEVDGITADKIRKQFPVFFKEDDSDGK